MLSSFNLNTPRNWSVNVALPTLAAELLLYEKIKTTIAEHNSTKIIIFYFVLSYLELLSSSISFPFEAL